MSLNKNIKSFNFANVLQTATSETKRKPDVLKGGRKKSYNSLELEDLAIEESEKVPLFNESSFVGRPEFITIAERSITGSVEIEISEADIQKMNDNENIIFFDSEYNFHVNDILLEIMPDSQDLKIFNTPKSKMKKQVLVDMEITSQHVPVLMTELGFFKPFRLHERSSYVKLVEPRMLVKVRISNSGAFVIQFDVQYSIQIQECCLYVHPFRTTCQITNLLDLVMEWNPVPYETPYKDHEIIENGYDKISSSTFYNMISDLKANDGHDTENLKLIIPELDTDLFKFQIKTVNWLLEKEGVTYNENTHTVEEKVFFSPSESSDLDEIGKCLDSVCFGWSMISLPPFPANEGKGTKFWYNKYTGNLTSSKFAAEFLASIDRVPARGLLAEEMGLGKTVEIVALVLLNQRKALEVDKLIWDPFSQREIFTAKTTLIICPDSILKQWYHEINNLASSLKITIYRGIYSYNKSNMNDINSESYKTPLQIAKSLSKFDIVLASYQTVSREIHHALFNPSTRPKRKCAVISRSKIHSATLEKDEDGNVIESKKEQINGEINDFEERNDFSSPLVLLQFWRIVLDEVQMVSSKISNAAKTAKIIPRHHSWGVSGTPIRKDLNDLHSFLLFSHLYPFNDNLSSLRANSLVWTKLINDGTVPTHFIRLFKNISLRHTKKMVSEEIQLPPQKRILFITDFTPVERNLYDHMFEEFLATVALSDKGDPLVDNWEPSSTVLAYMRDWLIKLRQTCCHSQIGTGSIIKRALNKNEDMHLRTVEAVLDLLIEDNESSIVSNERKLAMARIEKGQLYEHYSKPEKALNVFENCLPIVDELLINLKEDQVRWEKYAAKKNLSKQEEQSISDKIFILKSRTRSWLEILHRLYFFIASAHFQIYSPKEEEPPLNSAIDVDLPPAAKPVEIPDEDLTPEQLEHRKLENEYYEKAELLRREILSDPIEKVNKLVKEINESDVSQFQIPQIEEPKLGLIGLQATFFLEKYRNLVKELNMQGEVLNEWLNELTKLLSKLSKEEINTGNEGLEDDYQESLLVQDNAYAYLDVLQKALKDRNDSLIGVVDQSAVTSLIPRRQDDEDILIFKTSNTKTVFHKELEAKRKSIRPEATFQPNLSLRSMILNSKELSDAMAVSSGALPLEAQLFNDFSVIMKTTLDVQKNVFNKVKKGHFRQLNDLYNLRIEYYKSLQALSDHVKAYEPSDLNTYGTWNNESDEDFRHSQIDRKIATLESTKKAVAIRTRYLKSLKNIDSLENEEGRFCIICQSSIVTGVLTACGHQYCKECLDAWLKQSKRSCPMCKAHLDKDSIYNFTYTRANLKGSMLSGEEADENEKNSGIIHSIYQPIEEEVVRRIQDIDLHRSYGSKIDLILRLTKYLLNIEKDVQIVIFSQWSELLYLIGAALKYNGIQFLNSSETLNSKQGSGRRSKKLTDVDFFKKNKNITCFLLNAKAQASGLTLVNASHVFLCEPLVNTALELQAISRIHRIGQKKSTTIWMFAIENTVEESIVKLSTKKRLLYLNGTKKTSDTTQPDESIEKECDHPTRNDNEVTEMNMNETEIDTVNTAELTKTVEGMLDKKIFGGEVVPNDDLWSSFFS